MKFSNNFNFNRRTLSSYYVSILISYFLIQLIEPLVRTWTVFFADYFAVSDSTSFLATGRQWVVFYLICLIILILVRQFIAEPLTLFVDTDDGKGWEASILVLVLLGFYAYLLNQIFEYPMPREWWSPNWLIRLLGGYRATYLPGIPRASYQEEWWLLPWFWFLAPIGIIFARTKIAIKE